MTDAPDYVVVRDVPDGPYSGVDGWWFDLNTLPRSLTVVITGCVTLVAVPTGRFEVNADGAVAEVWEVQR